jgi:hypothetical protein
MLHAPILARAPQLPIDTNLEEAAQDGPVDPPMHAITEDTGAGSGASRTGDPAGSAGTHFENRAFYGVGTPPPGLDDVPRVDFVAVDDKGNVDPDVKATPGRGDPKTPGEMMNLQSDDLLARFRAGDENLYKALKSSDGPSLLLKIQTALNDEGRMFSLMSNLQSSDHETMKSIINNMRA